MLEFRQGDAEPVDLPLWEVVRTAHVLERAFRRAFARAELTPQQFGILASLADEPHCTRADLARNVMVRPQSVTSIVDGLLASELLQQQGPRGRGRPARLSITEEGWARLQRAWPEVVALNAGQRTGLDVAQARRLCAELTMLRERFDDG